MSTSKGKRKDHLVSIIFKGTSRDDIEAQVAEWELLNGPGRIELRHPVRREGNGMMLEVMVGPQISQGPLVCW